MARCHSAGKPQQQLRVQPARHAADPARCGRRGHARPAAAPPARHDSPAFAAGGKPEGWREEVVATYNGQQFGLYTRRMIRTREWKYVWNPTDVDELYDLQADPHELHNVVRHPEHFDSLRTLRRRMYETLHQEGDGLVRNYWMKEQLLTGRKL
ncbi:DUF4976 domain-containing protein [Paenibacillus sp. P26]|nr:DUF4976 domain-containing protein [Paenibacillus sp. P26]